MQRYLSIAILLILLSGGGLLLFSPDARAQEGEDAPIGDKNDGETRDALALDTTFTYNGFLEAFGMPINDSCDFAVALKNDAEATLQTINVNNEAVADGYFTVDLTFSRIYLDGRELSLDFTVDCDQIATNIVFSSAITAVPYAHTLRPGAEISGDDSIGILQIENNGAGDGIRIENAGDDGIQVTSAAYGINIASASNYGVYVGSSGGGGVYVGSSGGHGVQANSTGENQYGGYFTNGAASGSGYGLYAKSNQNNVADLVLGADSVSNGYGLISADDGHNYSDIRIESFDEIELQIGQDVVNLGSGSSSFTIFDGNDATLLSLDGSGNLSISGALTENATRRVGGADGDGMASREVEYGSISLIDGTATIALPDSWQSALRDTNYQVVLTPVGGYCPLYVAEKSLTEFVITADNGSDCAISVDYQIVAEMVSTSTEGTEE